MHLKCKVLFHYYYYLVEVIKYWIIWWSSQHKNFYGIYILQNYNFFYETSDLLKFVD